MDWTRLLLIAGIAFCSYLLLLEWDRRDTETADAAAETQAAGAELQENASGLSPVSPEPLLAAPSASDTPTHTQDASGLAAPAQATQVPEAAKSNLYAIHSDTLSLNIDLDNGEISAVELPLYAQNLHQPDQPVVLMDRLGVARYFARQGIQYLDGSALKLAFQPVTQEASDSATATTLSYSDGGNIEGQRTYRTTKGSYLVEIEEHIANTGSESLSVVPYAAFYRNDIPIDQTIGFGLASYLGPAWGSANDYYTKVDFDEVREDGLSESTTGGWIAMVQHYFVAAWVPQPEQVHLYQMKYLPQSDLYIAGLTSPALTIAPGDSATYSLKLYLGPKEQQTTRDIAPGLDLTIDYGWLWWLGQPLFTVLTWLHQLVGNWGWAIVLLTLLIKLAIYPLSATGFRSMAQLKKLQPRLEQLRKTHGKDQRVIAEKTMELYRKEGVNPLGGCLPLLLPMPVFIALYWVLLESVELRHAPWIFWIQDLAAPDAYFILPLLMGGSMFLSQLMSPMPATMEPMQRRILQMMPVIFTVFFLWFPSGLVLYWLVNNLLSIAQQWYINRTIN
ncbi:MAG: membrane protein insertase YidC [Gammaproteobacteria bacterium]